MRKVIDKQKFLFLLVIIFTCTGGFANSQTWVRKLAGFSLWGLEKDFQGNLWAGTTGSNRGIFKSTDGGENWTNMYSTGTTNYVDIATDSLGNVFVTAGSAGLLKSTDGGTTFQLIPGSNFNNKTLNTVACGRNGFVYAGATTGGVFASSDFGNTFTPTGLQTYSIVSLTVDRFNSSIVYAGASSTSANGFFKSTDGGFTFGTSTNPVNVWGIIQDNIGTLYTVSTSSGYPFCRSTDFGETWDTLANIPGAMRGGTIDLNGNLYSAGNGGVYRSTDGGHTFLNLGHAVASNQIVNWGDKILVASTGSSTGGIYIFQDPSVPVELNSFSAKLIDESVLLEWSTSTETNNLGFEIQRRIEENNNSISEFETIGFIRGVGTTTSENHYSYQDKLELHNIGGDDAKVYYRLKQLDLDGSFNFSSEINVERGGTNASLPNEFKLYQNYPNPFNPYTTITWEMPKKDFVALKIFDALGTLIFTIAEDFYEEGIHKISFTNSELNSGIYFLTLKTSTFSQTIKMTFLK